MARSLYLHHFFALIFLSFNFCYVLGSEHHDRMGTEWERWTRKHEFVSLSNKIRVKYTESSGWGFMAIDNIGEGEVVFSIQSQYLIDSQKVGYFLGALTSTPPKLLWRDETSALAVWLLLQRSVEKNGFWQPYLNILEHQNWKRFPILYGEEELQLYEASPIQTFAKRLRAKAENNYQYMMQEMEPLFKLLPSFFRRSYFTLERYLEAEAMVMSRSLFGPKLKSSKPSEDSSATRLFLLPFGDMWNHQPDSCKLKWTDKEMMVVTTRSYEPGMEVFLDYGADDKSNHNLLINYGFTLENNTVKSAPLIFDPKEYEGELAQLLELINAPQSKSLLAMKVLNLKENQFPLELITLMRHLQLKIYEGEEWGKAPMREKDEFLAFRATLIYVAKMRERSNKAAGWVEENIRKKLKFAFVGEDIKKDAATIRRYENIVLLNAVKKIKQSWQQILEEGNFPTFTVQQVPKNNVIYTHNITTIKNALETEEEIVLLKEHTPLFKNRSSILHFSPMECAETRFGLVDVHSPTQHNNSAIPAGKLANRADQELIELYQEPNEGIHAKIQLESNSANQNEHMEIIDLDNNHQEQDNTWKFVVESEIQELLNKATSVIDGFYNPKTRKVTPYVAREDLRRTIQDGDTVTIAIGVPTTSRGLQISSLIDLPFFQMLLPSVLGTSKDKGTINGRKIAFKYRFYLGFDDGDPFYDNEETIQKIKNLFKTATRGRDFDLKIIRLHSTDHAPAWAWNMIFRVAINDEDNDYFYQLNDDIYLKTAGWAESFIERLYNNKLLRNFGVTGPEDDTMIRDVLTQAFVHRTHMMIFSDFYPATLRNWFSDNWVSTVYNTENYLIDRKQIISNTKTGAEMRYEPCKVCHTFLEQEVQKGCGRIRRFLSAQLSKSSEHIDMERLYPCQLRQDLVYKIAIG